MADLRLIAVDLDEASIFWRNDAAELERRVAIDDLLASNRFVPMRKFVDGYDGPFRLHLGILDGRLVLTIKRADDALYEQIILAMSSFRRYIRDYHAICDSFHQATRDGNRAIIESIDMARRGIHNQAADLLIERLSGKVALDHETSRRLFTLIAVLASKGTA
ncbi:MAG: UPF0262 family protein [Alphaproteobacteria bacterium]|nr:UPF0262 family protein [Alphaproteobacteria bacterium]MDE2341280.1 UPF0262 family protein [Alphaproteobacteria bacterium]